MSRNGTVQEQEHVEAWKGLGEERLTEELGKAYKALNMVFNEAMTDDFVQRFVDPWDRFYDGSEWWFPLGFDRRGDPSSLGVADMALNNEQDLARMRYMGRMLATRNEYAINILENFVNYILGTGMTYLLRSKSKDDPRESLVERATESLEEYRELNGLDELEEEMVVRAHRDGEFFQRHFPQPDGTVIERMIEPEQVFTPRGESSNPDVRFGILFDSVDKQRPLGYYVDEVLVEAVEICHFKINVDRSIPRGISTFWAIQKDLERAEKLMQNMSKVAEIQAALVGVRKFANATEKQVNDFIDKSIKLKVVDRSDVQLNDGGFVRPNDFKAQQFRGGTILNMGRNMDFEFFSSAINAEKFIAIWEAQLQAAAARVGFPFFLLVSRGAGTGFAETLVQESPFVRMIQRWQKKFARFFKGTNWRALTHQAEYGDLPRTVMTQLTLVVDAPSPVVRDERKQAQANQIRFEHGVLSPQEWCQSEGRDYNRTMQDIKEHEEKYGLLKIPANKMDATQDEQTSGEDPTNDERRDRETDNNGDGNGG